jgi:hypothetical protein
VKFQPTLLSQEYQVYPKNILDFIRLINKFIIVEDMNKECLKLKFFKYSDMLHTVNNNNNHLHKNTWYNGHCLCYAA